jgi:hypothetical protein
VVLRQEAEQIESARTEKDRFAFSAAVQPNQTGAVKAKALKEEAAARFNRTHANPPSQPNEGGG